MKRARVVLAGALLVSVFAVAAPVSAASGKGGNGGAEYWTTARRAAATPRDLVVDARGLGYLKRADGSLAPHGHTTGQLYATPVAKARPVPAAKPGGGSDTSKPTLVSRDPAAGVAITPSYPFRATVTDTGTGVRSVTFVIVYPNGTQTQSITASNLGNNVWGADITGFTAGSWSWRIVAKDGARPANTLTSSTTGFTVTVGGGGGGGGGTVVNDPWTTAGTLQTAAGRIYFEMPANGPNSWAGYVCSGTVATDGMTGRSIIITAAHCVFDDANKVFARNVQFIPDQDTTTGAGTDTNCTNDRLGCWKPSFGVVDNDWANKTFPANIPWDYAFYVVSDTDPLAHVDGYTTTGDVLDSVAGSLAVQLSNGSIGQAAHALGYSYSDDPNFMYCSEALGSEASYNDYWLGACGLSGGSSGGPWVQPMSGGSGPIISVNSWGYTNQPGMAGPRLSSITGCVFNKAKTGAMAPSARGYIENC